MTNRIKVGHYEADNDLINLHLGFIPDVFDMDEVATSQPDHIRWYRQQEIAEADAAQGGMRTDGNSGQISKLSASNGIIAYDTSSQIPPIGIWEGSSGTIDTRDGVTLTVAARTSTAPGTYVNPTVGSSTDRQAVFECVTLGTTASSEPTWPDSIGENVTDGSMVCKRVDVSLQRGGYQGVVISANLNTNGQEWQYEAKQADQSIDHGDVEGWTSGIDPNA